MVKSKELDPLPVRVVEPASPPNPDIGKFIYEDEKPKSSSYRFTNNMAPGQVLECSPGRTVLRRADNKRKTVHDKYCFEDGNVYEVPDEHADFFNSLTYIERGMVRQRCSFVKVTL